MSKHVHIWSDHYFHRFNEVFVKEDKDNFYTCSSLSFLWMKHLNKNIENEATLLTAFDKGLWKYIESDKSSFTDTWIFSYPIETHTLLGFKDTFAFFDLYISYKNTNTVKALEKTIDIMEKKATHKSLKPLVSFILHKEDNKSERLRALVSGKITAILDT